MNRPAAPLLSSFIVFVSLIATLAPPLASAEEGERYKWKQEPDEAGCQIVTSAVSGKKYIASKATCTVNSRLDAVGAMLRDIPHYPNWMDDCLATTMLKVVDRENDVYVFWYRQHIPLLPDRDMVLRSDVSQGKADGKEWRSIVAASTNEITFDAKKGYVRMPSFSSEWRLEEIDADHTRVSFMIDPDLGGGMLVGVANSLIAQSPYKSIRGLIKELKERKQPLGSTTP